MQIKSAKDLTVYQKAYALATEIFAVSKGFPAEEEGLLTYKIKFGVPLALFVQICQRHGQSAGTKRILGVS